MTKPVKYFTKHHSSSEWESCNAQTVGVAKAVATRRNHNRVGELRGDRIYGVANVALDNTRVWRETP